VKPDPFLIAGPALLSFSGGRTSGMMLRRVLDAHGGTLPPDIHVCFANTGKELEETLRFVHECGARWGVDVHWLEYRSGESKSGTVQFEEVGYNSASRAGEPFDLLIAKKQALPNWQARWCSSHLKVLVMFAYMAQLGHGPGTYTEIVGLRADEPWRVAKMIGRNADDNRLCVAPLSRAGVTQRDVMAFWADQPFDLGIAPGRGNCDLCFMKGAGLRASLMRDNPALARWWADHEASTGRFFDRRTRYATLLRDVERQPELFARDSDPADEHDAECGLWCGSD
jgi:3'-phosphoadenosine 5'-phosphosulfate sulfotransferase (PAPS reductase)/FAD synthetase